MAVRYEEDEKPEVSLTSMMDCSFLMLIFFLVSSQLKKVEKEVPLEPDGIPLALLPDTADPDLWETVADMTGEIDGTHLSFKRGIATANGTVYKAVLDFCRGGDRIYARVDGPKRYVVCLDGQGRIVKTYRAPGNNKPLKAIFGK